MNTKQIKAHTLTLQIAAAYYNSNFKWHNQVRPTASLFKQQIYALDCCKLQLMPASLITFDDSIEIAQLCLPESERRDSSRDKLAYIGCGIVMYHFGEMTPWHNNDRYDNISTRLRIVESLQTNETAVIDTLRGKCYDIGYGRMPSLISARLAEPILPPTPPKI